MNERKKIIDIFQVKTTTTATAKQQQQQQQECHMKAMALTFLEFFTYMCPFIIIISLKTENKNSIYRNVF